MVPVIVGNSHLGLESLVFSKRVADSKSHYLHVAGLRVAAFSVYFSVKICSLWHEQPEPKGESESDSSHRSSCLRSENLGLMRILGFHGGNSYLKARQAY